MSDFFWFKSNLDFRNFDGKTVEFRVLSTDKNGPVNVADRGRFHSFGREGEMFVTIIYTIVYPYPQGAATAYVNLNKEQAEHITIHPRPEVADLLLVDPNFRPIL